MAIDVLRADHWIEQRGAASGRRTYSGREQRGDAVAAQFGIARLWKRITLALYVIAICLMVLPVGGAGHYAGVLVWTVSLWPLICWLVARRAFRQAVKATPSPNG